MTKLTPPDPPSGSGDGHPEIDELTAHAGGDLGEPDATRVAAHVRSCPDCTADLDALGALARDLATVPALIMPAEVADRLDAVIRRERPAKARRGTPVWARAAAGVALLALSGAVVVGVTTSRGSNDHSKSAPAAGLATEAGPEAAPNTLFSGPDSPSPAAGAQTATLVDVLSSGTAYSRDRGEFARQVRAAQSGSASAVPLARLDVGDTAAETAPVPSARSSGLVQEKLLALTARERLRSCVVLLTGGEPDVLLSVDLAKFLGQPAAVMVFAGATDDTYSVYVVNPDCGQTESDPVLHYEVVTRQ